MLLGVAADKMYYESYGRRRLAAMGRAAGGGHRVAIAVRECCDVRTAAADIPRTARTARLPHRRVLPALLGFVLIVTTLIAAGTALGFTFDPRYRDFPFASLTMAVVPFAALMLLNRPKEGVRPIAESAFAGLLVAAALFTGINEGNQNWQSMWTCAVYLLLALTLWRARAVQIPK